MSDFDPTLHPHRRCDSRSAYPSENILLSDCPDNPLTKEFILVSPNRSKRPWQGQIEPPSVPNPPKYDSKCYLCPGNSRAGGQQNEKYGKTMVSLVPPHSPRHKREHVTQIFENDFPALLPPPAPKGPKSQHPLLQSDPVQGACDVVIFHPRHDLTLARLLPSDIERIIREWTNLYIRRGRQQGIKYVQIFEVRGRSIFVVL